MITCGIYLYNTQNGKILVCHATHSNWKTWTIPKGLKLPGENSYTTAKRELKEETGIDLEKINVLKVIPLSAVENQKQNRTLESFLVITNTDMDNRLFHCASHINREFPELNSWKWISPNAITKYLHESQQENLNMINELLKLQVPEI